MYESPINKIIGEIQSQLVKDEEGQWMVQVTQAGGYDINKDELIKALNYDRQQYEKGYKDGLNANRWIPVRERLPEDGGNYLVTIAFDIGAKEPVREVYKDFFCVLSKKWLNHNEDVIAWCESPEPYKE